MATYRVPEFTLEQRADAALRMLVPFPEREWGLGVELSRLYGVSRTLLYKIRDRARDAILEALLPQEAGRPARATTLTVDKALVDRTIATLSLLKGSVRDIRLGLSLILGVTRSVGYISRTLTVAGEQATTRWALVPGAEPDACAVPRCHHLGTDLPRTGGAWHSLPRLGR